MTPQILCTLFYSENFFTSTCHNKKNKTLFPAGVGPKPQVIFTSSCTIQFPIMGNSATAYSIIFKMYDLHANKSEEHEIEGTNLSSFHELISEMAIHIQHVLGIIVCVFSL